MGPNLPECRGMISTLVLLAAPAQDTIGLLGHVGTPPPRIDLSVETSVLDRSYFIFYFLGLCLDV